MNLDNLGLSKSWDFTTTGLMESFLHESDSSGVPIHWDFGERVSDCLDPKIDFVATCNDS